ncbi:MAG: hydantoinase B/oxoprolinase family protein [Desulfobacula sp.]|nr:hydantoinase B/oxoprolinase family protein [Desulfobacula sp.]MBT7261055.1 hydantoinase B/oxoprolinase family protein [Desulfobacula sp.]
MENKIDQILASVFQRRFKSITEEMGLTLLRTTRSPILNEARDFVTGLYDHQGRMLEQTEYIPVLAFAIQPALEYIVRYFGDDIFEGDVIIHNDVFSGGNQNNDVAVFKPIFHEGRLIGWAACKGHQADIGGAVAGGYNPEAREVWQEALRITPVKIYEAGKFRKDVWDMIFANIRYKIVEEDIKAEMGGCIVGERGVKALLERYGIPKFQNHVNYLFDVTEKMVRKEIDRIPDGIYPGESYVFYDGIHEASKMKINLNVVVKGDKIIFDYSGSDSQTEGFVNAPLAATSSAVLLTFLMLINPDIPHNDGIIRPIKIVSPKGTFLNAEYPAATTFGNSITGPNADAIMKAFSTILSKKVTAGWNRFLGFTLTGKDPRNKRSYVDILFLALKGGSGGTYMADGYDHIGLINCAGGILAQDYEMFEIQDPHFLVKHEYLRDSAGAGQWRGGLGVETIFEIYGENVTGIAFGDGVEEEARAFGLFGGKEGSINKVELLYPDGTIRIAKSKEIIRDIPKNTLFQNIAGGGGGYGDPFLRPVDRVLDDVKNELVSTKRAKKDYGVVIDEVTMDVDQEATKSLRRRS